MIRSLSDGRQRKMKEICDSEEIPPQFAYKILKKLEKGGIVKIIRGVKGGCRLDTDLRLCSLYQVFAILGEKQVALTDSGLDVQRHLVKIQDSLDEMLKNQSLEELLK